MPKLITTFSVTTEFGTSVVEMIKRGGNVFESDFRTKETVQNILLNVHHQYDPIYEAIHYNDDGTLDEDTIETGVDKPINNLSKEDTLYILQCACAYIATKYPGNRWRLTISKSNVRGVDGCIIKCTPSNLHDVGASHCITFVIVIGTEAFTSGGETHD